MNIRTIFFFFYAVVSLSLTAQNQSWQWIKAGGSNSDNASVNAAECKIAGCDARGNIYAIGSINGPHMSFDTFSSPGAYSVNNVGVSYLLFSYDCSGNMRWAKEIGDEEGNSSLYGVTSDLQGNIYFAAQFWYGSSTINGQVKLHLGDTVVFPPVYLDVPYLCMGKYDSLGRLVWFKNFQNDTTNDSHVVNFQSGAYGLRIGSSGNLWMACTLDSNYAISPNLHTGKRGRYNVEVNPSNGDIMGGYYLAQQNIFGDAYHPDANYDLDENENYYETGNLLATIAGQNNGDTLILENRTFAADTNYFKRVFVPYIFSLDKHGNFRFLISQDTMLGNPNIGFRACKFDALNNQLITACYLGDSGVRIQGASFGYHPHNLGPNGAGTEGIYCIDAGGSLKWCKYLTNAGGSLGPIFQDVMLPDYVGGLDVGGTQIFNNTDTIKVSNSPCISNCSYYYKLITQIDGNGKIKATHIADFGDINLNGVEGDQTPSGAKDWRGNLYMGGSITNYIATPTDSLVNTDRTSGNFFIAKIGISDCSCTTPGTQFTQLAHGDTVRFSGSSIHPHDSILWRLGDSSIFVGDTFTHVYHHDGSYTVTAIGYSPCGVDSITKQITVRTVGIDVIEPNKTQVYPNPVTDIINLDVSGAAKIGLLSANGTMLWDAPKQFNQAGTYVFDINRYAAGLYYIVVEYPSGNVEVLSVTKE